ncbi:DUF1707 SHOCT-like domain-containing protein [Subtercola endophyticus]|uniref:DUF1707 SHOCT-like domain-containing protein n=1 Tax=Subtercola endophyticus TaxID=2895559 RepID=UPI001E51133A|nr:DUF1707 domain-containing protein [Subtercola endophyticus]UFS57894.1 DUF1707 domain-containing protein [Subtercola endophyticus]
MTDFTDPQTATLRLSNPERDEAVAQLNANLREGRITEAEFTERSATVRSAVTRGDVAPVFSDLPADAHLGAASSVPPAAFAAPGYSSSSSSFGSSIPEPRNGPIGGTAGVVAVSITPFIALILFFVTGIVWGYNYSWLWFLLVPLVGIIVYGGGTRRRPDRH